MRKISIGQNDQLAEGPLDQLNPRQQAFCTQYVVDFNATQAAIRAGYSERSARQYGHSLLGKPSVQAAITRMMESKASEADFARDEILARLSRIAAFNAADYFEVGADGEISIDEKRLANNPAVVDGVVDVSIKAGKNGHRVVVKAPDKLKALKMLGQHYGMFQTDRGRRVSQR